jgi:hypothetical protein
LVWSQYGPAQAALFGGAVPLTHYPPLFPLVVAGVASFGLSIASAARVLNAVLFGVNLVLVGLLTTKVTRARVAPIAVVLLLLAGTVWFSSPFGLNQSWLILHSLAMSEPLFITWSLLALLLLSRYLSAGRIQDLLGASACVGLALLTRYAGISLVIAAVIVIMLWGPGSRAARSRASGLLLAVSLLPSIAWALYNSLVQHGTAPRSFRSHTADISDVVKVMEGWLTPASWPGFLRDGLLLVAAGIVIAALIGLNTRRRWRDGAVGPFRLFFTFVCVYIAVVILTRDFLDVSTPFNARLFAPIQAPFSILVISSLWLLLANRPRTQDRRVVGAYFGIKPPRVASETLICVAVSLIVAVPALHTSIDTVVDGFPDRAPKSPTLAAAGQLPKDVFIATDAGDSLWFETGRASIGVPSLGDPTTGKRNPRVSLQLVELVSRVRSRKGVIVLQGNPIWTQRATESYFACCFPSLHVLLRLKDGVIIGRRDTVAQLASQPPHIRLRVVPRTRRPITAKWG